MRALAKSMFRCFSLLLAVAPFAAAAPSAGEDAPEPTARELLERAARFQRGETPRPAPRSFHGRFYATLRNPQDGSSVNLFLERFYEREPERMVTHRRDTLVGTDSTRGFDGRRSWVRDNVSGRVDLLDARPDVFETDLAEEAHQLRLTRILLDMALLDALLPRLQDATRVPGGPRVKDLEGETHAVLGVQAWMEDDLFEPDPDAPPLLPGDPAPRLELFFALDAQSGALWRLELRSLDRVRPRRVEVAVGLYRPNRQGLMVPANLRVSEDGAVTPSLVLGADALLLETPEGEQEVVAFELDVPLDSKIFSPPESAVR